MKKLSLLCGVSVCLPMLMAQEPRISSLAPTAGLAPNNTELIDADGDGDLDLVSVYDSFSSNTGFIWSENMGNRNFSSSKTYHYSYRFFNGFFNGSLGEYYFLFDGDSDGILELGSLVWPDTQVHELEIWVSPAFESGSQSGFKRGSQFDQAVEFSFPTVLKLDDAIQATLIRTVNQEPTQFSLSRVTKDGLLVDWTSPLLTVPETVLGLSEGSSVSFIAHDLDGDQDLDLVASYGDNVIIFERLSQDEFAATPSIFSGRIQKEIDFDTDGDLDLILRHDQLTFWINDLTTGGFEFTELPDADPNLPSGAFIEGRGIVDFETSTSQENPVVVHYQADELGIFSEVYRQELLGPNIACGLNSASGFAQQEFILSDFDGDGVRDLTVICFGIDLKTGGTTQEISIFRWDGQQYELILSPEVGEVFNYNEHAVADFDRDGDMDVLIAPGSKNLGQLLLNDGDGNFTTSGNHPQLFPPSLNAQQYRVSNLQAVKFDDDDHWDLAFSYYSIPETFMGPANQLGEGVACIIVKGNGDGTFQEPVLPDGALGIAAGGFCDLEEFVDWDGDGDLDAIVEGGWRENIDGELALGMRPLLSNVSGTDALGNPVALRGHAIGDIDGDGSPDYVTYFGRRVEDCEPNGGIFGGWFFNEAVPCVELAVAFNDGSGGIADVVYYPANASIGMRDALGNLVREPVFYLLDLDEDGRDEMIYVSSADTDALGNPVNLRLSRVITDQSNPRDLSLSRELPLPIGANFNPVEIDFNGDGIVNVAGSNQYIEPSSIGPVFSRFYDFIGNYLFPRDSSGGRVSIADFDGDGDADSLYARSGLDLILVRNLIVDERSSITAALMESGLTGLESTPTSDADGDGLSNEEELLRGTDPLQPDVEMAEDLSPSIEAVGGAPVVSFLRRRDEAVSEFQLEYALQRSRDLEVWEDLPLGSAPVEVLDDRWERLNLNVFEPNGSFYYRTAPRHRVGEVN